ncbi:FecCD family ABC transporter permease [Nocardioides albus]|uniref:Iron complex transport system permease protein n=1 Tax=Nocardioides albus TaxID=1841 RepID=A0A7W5A661_9ACTN|nr:iron ABC transporter permease [Nocardioides albus]MBB3090180.1 iron complex transport system permease protein [Nocardioides albus]GGU28281.1 ABC transporter permease [Nocardioides albus]
MTTSLTSRPGSAPADPAAQLRGTRRTRSLALLVLAAAVLAAAATSIVLGSRDASWTDIWAGVSGQAEGFAQAAVAKRVPRTVLAAVAGAALAVSGLVLQGITRNPLADPGILGVNTGASLAVVSGIAWFGLASPTSYIWVAILGAALASAFVWTVGSLGRGGATPLKLTLAGAATAAALSSFVTAVVLPRPDISENVVSWQVGGVGGATDDKLWLMAPFLLAGALLCVWCARGLNMLGLGDDLASGLGEHVNRTRLLAAAGAVTLAGATTAITGPIAFVGLVVPHLGRLLIGTDHRWLLPFSVMGGAVLLLVADVLGRVVAPPTEVDVGIITALIGAPVLIAVVRQAKVREL